MRRWSEVISYTTPVHQPHEMAHGAHVPQRRPAAAAARARAPPVQCIKCSAGSWQCVGMQDQLGDCDWLVSGRSRFCGHASASTSRGGWLERIKSPTAELGSVWMCWAVPFSFFWAEL
jgi:hypothetical protein